MTHSYTKTETWSYVYARRVAGKVAADLRQMRQEYGEPSEARIERYLQELTVLMAGGYVDKVVYGYSSNAEWVVALEYTAEMDGTLASDDRSGRIPRRADISGLSFSSFLSHSTKWGELTETERAAIQRELPFPRSTGQEPSVPVGARLHDKTYSDAGCGLRRASIGGAR